jgi:hypothetical protein
MGVGLTLALLSSMLMATPAAAGTLSISAESDIPDTEENVLAPAGADILDMAVNGDTIFAAIGNTAANNYVYKSTDGGAGWTSLHSTTSYPSGDNALLVAVAPDDPDVVCAVFDDFHVEYSSNGGSSWSDMGIPTGATSIMDLDVSVSSGGAHYIAVGGAAGTEAELWTLKLDIAQSWSARADSKESPSGNFSANQDVIAAVKHSPNFGTDKIILAVSGNTNSATLNAFRYESGAYTWNQGITFFNVDWGTGVALGDIATAISGGVAAASIAIPDSYLGTDEGERVCFVGVAGTAAGGGVLRVVDAYDKKFETWSAGDEGPIGSVAYHEAGKLLAGDWDQGQVYRCLSPMASSPKFERLKYLKQPGGSSATEVGFSGDIAIAGTSGDESAFSTSADDGYSFVDVSMIDTCLTTMTDVEVAMDGSVTYLATADGNDASVWANSSSWKRIFSMVDTVNPTFLIRAAPEDPLAVYIAATGSTDIWMSKDGGINNWTHVPCYKINSVQDYAVKDADTVFAMDTAGVSKTTNAGASWGSKKTSNVTGHMLSIAPNGDILVGGSGGYVSFSKDNGSTFTKISDQVASGNAYVIADEDYEDNNMIFCGVGQTVKRGAAEKTKSWSTRAPTFVGSEVVTGIGRYGSVIYISTSDGTDGSMFRALNLADADTSALALWSGLSKSGYALDAAPQALKISSGPKLWYIDTSGTDQLASTKDPIAATGPTLVAPEDNAIVAVNPESGRAYNLAFTWQRYPSSTIVSMDIQIATDENFDGIILNLTATGITTDTIARSVGPTATAPANIELEPGRMYYWRVRVSQNGPMYSPFSEVRSFTVQHVVKFMVSGPEMGATGVGTMPTLVWTGYPDALNYQVELAEDPTFAILDASATATDTFYQVGDALPYNTTYYWRVRAVTKEGYAVGNTAYPPETSEWITGVFTIMAEPEDPMPPVVIEPTPPPADPVVIEVPTAAPIPPYLLWSVIGIGALLVIALIILILRTRRVS